MLINNSRIRQCLILAASVCLAKPVIAEVVYDGSTGTSGSVAGPDFVVPESAGVRFDSNLVHSFTEFNISASESVTFTGDAAIQNVLARVTGTNASMLDGLIKSDIATANIWFMNPNGVVIGENAILSIDGSFLVTTADGISLSDGSVFMVDTDLSAPSLTIADPTGFVFLLTDAASIDVYAGDKSSAGSGLTLDSGDLVLAGGDITIDSANIQVGDGALALVSSGDGLVGLDSVTNPGGDISIVDSTIDVGEASGGDLYIVGGNLLLLDSEVNAKNSDALLQGETINVGGSNLTFLASVSNNQNTVNISAGSLSIENGSTILTATDIDSSSVSAANLNFIANEDVLVENSTIVSRVTSGSTNSEGGDINIATNNFTLYGANATIALLNQAADGSLTGNVDISAQNTLSILQGASIAQSIGDGGRILLTAHDMFAINSNDALVPLFDGSDAPAQVFINADTLTLDASNLNNRVTDNSDAGIFEINVGDLVLRNGSSINTKTFGNANGVDLSINADSVAVLDGSFIGASTLGGGNGGSINIVAANQVVLSGEGSLYASSLRSTTGDLSFADDLVGAAALISRDGFGEGNGGVINVTSSHIALKDGAQITAYAADLDEAAIGRSIENGNAGNVNITSSSTFEMSGGASIDTQAIESAGGNVQIQVVDTIKIIDSDITAEAGGVSSTDAGGNIFIDPELLVFDNALVNANANAGNGGNVTIIADNIIRSLDTSITASSRLGVDGAIEVEGVTNEASTLETTPVSYDDVASLLSQKCAVASLKDRSSFVIEQQSKIGFVPDSFQHANMLDERIKPKLAHIGYQEDPSVIENCYF